MEIDLMSIGSEDALAKCRQPRAEVMELISPIVESRDYGSSVEFFGVGVVIQDVDLIPLGTRVFRKKKEINVDVELSKRWLKGAGGDEIKLALLGCLIKAVQVAGQRRSVKNSDLKSKELAADSETLAKSMHAEPQGFWKPIIRGSTKEK